MSILDWLIVALYFLAVVTVGVWFTRRASKSTEDYFVAGRNLSWFIAGTSIVATTFSSDTPLVVAGISHQSGISGHWFWLSAAVGQIATIFFFARLWRRTEALTDIEFIAQKAIRYVEITEYQALLAATEKVWWKALISVAYGSGLRRDEIFSLTWQDIDFENKLICINAKKPAELLIEWEPKDHHNRIVPLAEQTLRLLAGIQLSAPARHPYIFINPERFGLIKKRERAGKWNPRCPVVNNAVRDFGVIRKRAGIAKCTLHDLRRSAITN